MPAPSRVGLKRLPHRPPLGISGIIPRVRLNGQRILVVSNEPWGPVWYSKHHYAASLAARNDVVFADPARRFHPRPGAGPEVQPTGERPRLWRLTYGNPIPFSGRLRPLLELNEGIVCRRILRVLGSRGLAPTLFWSFDPHRLIRPARLGVRASVYQMMDYYRVPWEAELVANSDLVLAVSPGLIERQAWARPVHLVPHGVAEPPFSREQIVAADVRREAVLVGTLTPRVDYAMLLALAEADPSLLLRIVGPLQPHGFAAHDMQLLQLLRGRGNVEFVGVRDQFGLAQDILHAGVGLCAYKQDAPGNLLNSLKVLQYLALGKPVVSTPLEAHAGTPSGFVRIAGSREEWVAACLHQLSVLDTAADRLGRIEFAMQFTYSRILERLERLLQASLARD